MPLDPWQPIAEYFVDISGSDDHEVVSALLGVRIRLEDFRDLVDTSMQVVSETEEAHEVSSLLMDVQFGQAQYHLTAIK